VNLNGAARSFDIADGSASVDMTIGAAVTGGALATVNKIGAGNLRLTGLNTYTGATAVNVGTLEVNSNTGGSTAIGTSVALGAVLAGTGTVSGATATHTVNGTVSPGANAGTSLGVLNFEAGSSVTFNPGSSAIFQIGDPTLTYDKIKTTGGGTLTLDSTLTITVNGFDAGYTPVITDVWTLLDWGTIAGNGFNVGTNLRTGGLGGGTLDLPDVSSYGLFWEVSNFTSNGSISFYAVPEPGRVLLMFFGLAALFMRRRRQA
jgi:fibronectin-binding autotransporter adhesin